MSLFNTMKEQYIKTVDGTLGKETVLKEIARLAKNSDILATIPEEDIYTALLNREEVGSTGFGDGIAIPHCSFDSIDDFVVGLLLSPEGSDFDSLDEKPVKVFAFIIGPKASRNEHIHLLSEISRVLNNKKALQELLTEKTSETILESFLRYVRDDVDPSLNSQKSLFHIFIQNEDKLEKILEVISEINDSSISVIDANDASKYFQRMPLFAGFLDNKDKGSHKLVIAIVNKKLTNETLRQITKVTGDLTNAQDICVLVQDIIFCAGAINF